MSLGSGSEWSSCATYHRANVESSHDTSSKQISADMCDPLLGEDVLRFAPNIYGLSFGLVQSNSTCP